MVESSVSNLQSSAIHLHLLRQGKRVISREGGFASKVFCVRVRAWGTSVCNTCQLSWSGY